MASFPPDDSLSRSLREWKVHPPRDPAFRASVWARIDAARRPSTWTRFARTHPAVVGSMLAVAVVAGAISGRMEARERRQAERESIAANYVHALDARWLRQQ